MALHMSTTMEDVGAMQQGDSMLKTVELLPLFKRGDLKTKKNLNGAKFLIHCKFTFLHFTSTPSPLHTQSSHNLRIIKASRGPRTLHLKCKQPIVVSYRTQINGSCMSVHIVKNI